MAAKDPTDILTELDGADPERVSESVKRDVEDFKWVMSNRRGRRFAHRLLDQCGVFRSSFTGNSTTFFNEGQRNIGLQVLAMVNEHTPDAYVLMLKEHKEDERNNPSRPSDH